MTTMAKLLTLKEQMGKPSNLIKLRVGNVNFFRGGQSIPRATY